MFHEKLVLWWLNIGKFPFILLYKLIKAALKVTFVPEICRIHALWNARVFVLLLQISF